MCIYIYILINILSRVGVRCPQNRVLQTLSQKDYARRKKPLCADYARTTRGGETNNKCNSGKTIHHTESDFLLWFAIQIVTVAVDSYRCPIYFIVSLSLSLFLSLSLSLSLYIYIYTRTMLSVISYNISYMFHVVSYTFHILSYIYICLRMFYTFPIYVLYVLSH